MPVLPDPERPIDPALEPALARVQDPELHRSLLELGMIARATIEDGRARATVRLTIVGCPAAQRIERDVREALERVVGPGRAEVTLEVMDDDEREALLERVRGRRGNPFGPGTLTRVVAVASGKGGVGKSTVTASLAAELARRGRRVGVVDADVYGFSIPGQLGITTGPTRLDEHMMVPPVGHGVRAISIGMFVGADHAVSWRGPMLQRTLQQFLTDVHFGDLDVLLLDLPPGTGDVAITAGQLLPDAEVIVVTTPQPASSTVAVRAGLLADRLGQRVIGVVENMAWLAGPDGARVELFGAGGGRRAADALSTELETPVPLLASVPISIPLREGADLGSPAVLTHPDDPAVVALRAVADLLDGPRGLAGRHLPLQVG